MQILAEHHIRPNLLQDYQNMWSRLTATIVWELFPGCVCFVVLIITEIIFSSTVKMGADIFTPNQIHEENYAFSYSML